MPRFRKSTRLHSGNKLFHFSIHRDGVVPHPDYVFCLCMHGTSRQSLLRRKTLKKDYSIGAYCFDNSPSSDLSRGETS